MRTNMATLITRLTLLVVTGLCCVPAFSQQSVTPSIKALFNFTCTGNICPKGAFPVGLLIQGSDGNFYGVTSRGGTTSNSGGTIFKITPTGILHTLFGFDPALNGSFPNGKTPTGSLAEGNDGFLYGTASLGGAHGAGTVFKISKTGVFQRLYSFCSLLNCADGSSPTSLVLAKDGNFYGGTTSKGAHNSGTIFRMSASGSLRTVHVLNGTTDGGAPNALVQASDGNFYGTTTISATGQLGTIFQVTASGIFTTLYDFSSPPNADPLGRLLEASDGHLYGGTFYGEIFRSTLTGSFDITAQTPTTVRGGVIEASDGNLWGAHSPLDLTEPSNIFSQTLAGQALEQVAFHCAQTGGAPQGIIQGRDGKLYGLANSCVDSSGTQHFGTVFAVDAGLPLPTVSLTANR